MPNFLCRTGELLQLGGCCRLQRQGYTEGEDAIFRFKKAVSPIALGDGTDALAAVTVIVAAG